MANPNFGFDTTAEEVASYHSSSIKGKTFLVTGVTPGGLGLYTAKVLAAHSPALIILAARSAATLSAAQAEVAEVAKVPTKLLTLDLGSIRTVRAAAAEVNSWDDVPKIDVLINNAGIMSVPFALSEDGIESQFATNHIGTFLFTNLIIDKIIAAKGRIVNLSSSGHRFGPVRFDDWNFQNGKEYPAIGASVVDPAYGQSKTANILHAAALAERLKDKGVTAFSVHPGGIFTNLGRYVSMEMWKERGVLDEDGNLIPNGPFKLKQISQGTATTITAALDPNIADHSGGYLDDCQLAPQNLSEWATGKENADKLWALSEKLVGQTFDF
ncbi:NAD(P)-binding protein [Lojkania enalia]|uniref:NAD(P)-binding protein n=1 Tax=Lojkania enalia TaxID=147567 RepID=A0A9P4N814_9PLEO|nr:NAD(P)-binding protein [Didymosphaeria enalia]